MDGSLIPGVGPIPCDGMIIGEAPGAEEEKQGVPFVGASGYRLSEALAAAGLQRADVYITNVFKKRPPENRDPTQEEIESHHDLLVDELNAVRPKAVLALGRYAANWFLGVDSVSGHRVRGPQEQESFVVFPTWHPAYTLYRRNDQEITEQFYHDVRAFVEAWN